MDYSKGEPVSPSAALLAELHSRAVPTQSDYADGYGRRFSAEDDAKNAAYLDPEKDLALDATWKQMQQNTFTRWVNEHLKTCFLSINSLETDLSDGLLLIALIEVLSGKKLPRHTKKPVFRSQKLENVSVALQFLEEEEGIKLVSIDSTDIVDHKLKLILGLIWALILHYALSKPKWEGDPDSDGQGQKKVTAPKQRLMQWFHNKLPELPVKNFTTDWNDGRACGALDNAVAPGLCPDWQNWDPKDALRNATEAMALAEKWLGVAQLIRPEDMIDPHIDEQSMMTYLAQFPIAKVKPGAPVQATSTRTEAQEVPRSPVPPRVHRERVYCGGRGIQKTGVRVGDVVSVKVSAKDAGTGQLTIGVTGPDGVAEETDMQVLPDGAYECYYCPSKKGPHTVNVQFADEHVAKSPYEVMVKPVLTSTVRCYGPGLYSGAVGLPADFSVEVNKEPGMLGFVIEGTSQVKIECSDRGDMVARVRYWASKPGEYAVHVLLDNEDVPGSPFMAEIMQLPADVYPDKVKVDMSGCKAVKVGEPMEVVVDTKDAGKAPLEVLVLDSGYDLIINKRQMSRGVYQYSFVPEENIPHIVMVHFAGVSIGESPFTIPIDSPSKTRVVMSANEVVPPRASRSSDNLLATVDTSTIRITGFDPKAYLNKMSEFTVDTTAVAGRLDGQLRVSIASPAGISSDALVSQKSPGIYTVSFSVFEEGAHALTMLYDGNPVHGSPLTITAIRSGSATSTGSPTGNQISRTTSHVSEETTEDGTTIITRHETLTIREVVSSSHMENMVESFESSGLAEESNGLTLNSFEMTQADASKVVVSGMDEKKVYVNKPNTFMVKADAAGYNVLMVGVYGKIANAHEIKVTHVGQATYQVVYTLKERGEYLLHVKYGDEHIPNSPFLVTCN